MSKRVVVLLAMTLVLSGCWDEQNFNKSIHVPMSGISGNTNNLEISFALPAVERKLDVSRTITVQGKTFLDARANAGTSTHNQIDTSMLTSLIIEDAAAKTDIVLI